MSHTAPIRWVSLVVAIAACLAATADNAAPKPYFPPPESQGGWRTAQDRPNLAALAGMDEPRLQALRAWLLASDKRPFAAVVIRRGVLVLQVERGNSASKDTRNIKSCAKAVCATVLAIASEQSQQGKLPRKMTFADKAFDYIPWADPLSDPHKADITVGQLLNHTSGICPESTRAANAGPWQLIVGHDGDPRCNRLAFAPGSDLDYSTHAFYHASLVCETVTGSPYDQFAIANLLAPIGIEKWWFEYFPGDARHGRHPSHAIGLSARDMARIGYCMLHNGKWNDNQIIPDWFIRQTGSATHTVTGSRSFGRNAESFSSGWELPGQLANPQSAGIPKDARFKPGSGGQLIAFVPSLELLIARQTGGSGAWAYEEFLRLAVEAVIPTGE